MPSTLENETKRNEKLSRHAPVWQVSDALFAEQRDEQLADRAGRERRRGGDSGRSVELELECVRWCRCLGWGGHGDGLERVVWRRR